MRACEGAAPGTAAAPEDQPDTNQTGHSVFKVARALSPEALAAVGELLAAMPDPGAEVELWRKLCREMCDAAFAEGWRLGVEHGARVRAAEWPAIVAPLSAPDQAELELLRYGPGGREHFADPRPGDMVPPAQLSAAS